MIVYRTSDAWEIIFQHAHALLAAELAAHWPAERHRIPAAHWVETLAAIAQHDNGWQQWDVVDRLTDAGEPRDFTKTKLEDTLKQAQDVNTNARRQNRWIGMLISCHASHLYEENRGKLPAFDDFLDMQRAMQAAYQKDFSISQAEMQRIYTLLRWTDQLSLSLCQRRLEAPASAAALGIGPDGVDYSAHRRADTITVTPWPFEMPRFSVSVEFRRVSQHTFASDEELESTLENTPVEMLTWRFAE